MFRKSVFITLVVCIWMANCCPTSFAEDPERILDGITVSSTAEDDFILPLEQDGAIITWQSNDSNAIAIAGDTAIVLRNAGQRTVKLTATAIKDGAYAVKEFTVTVPKAEYTGNYYLNESFEETEPGSLPADGKWLPDKSMNQSLVVENEAGDGYDAYLAVAAGTDNHYLRIYKTPGIQLDQQSTIYAAVADLPEVGDLVIEYRYAVLSLPAGGDTMCPWLTASGNNTIGTQFLRLSSYYESDEQYATMAPAGDDAVKGTMKERFSYGETWHTGIVSASTTASLENNVSESWFDFYIDGVLKGESRQSKDNQGTYIKNLLFGFDNSAAKGGELWFDDVKIYANEASAALRSMTFSTLGCEDPTVLTEDLQLPEEINGVPLTYYSSDPDILTADGIVTAPAEGFSADVSLFAVAEKDGFRNVKEFLLKVLSNRGVLANDLENLKLPDIAYDSLQLPDQGASGSAISWTSDIPEIISNEGIVRRGGVDRVVTLTATATDGSDTVAKSIQVLVPKVQPQDSVHLLATEDTWVRKDNGGANADKNFGTETAFALDGGETDRRVAYLRYEMDKAQPAFDDLDKKYFLRVTVAGGKPPENAKLIVYGLTDSLKTNWEADTLTYNQSVELGLEDYTENQLAAIDLDPEIQDYKIDITQYVKEQLQTDGIVAIKLEAAGAVYQIWATECNNAERQPVIMTERGFDEVEMAGLPGFYQNGEIVTQFGPGDVTVRAVYTNFGVTPKNAILLVALYHNENGIPVLEDVVVTQQEKVAYGVSVELSETVTVPADGNYEIKAFVWKTMEDMVPRSMAICPGNS